MFRFKGIDHVQLAAPKGSESDARHFFSHILGFEELEKPESLKSRGGVWFQAGNHQVHIGIEESFTPAKKAHPAFEVQNLEELKIHLNENQIKFTSDDLLPSANRIYVQDPFGNRIEILEWL